MIRCSRCKQRFPAGHFIGAKGTLVKCCKRCREYKKSYERTARGREVKLRYANKPKGDKQCSRCKAWFPACDFQGPSGEIRGMCRHCWEHYQNYSKSKAYKVHQRTYRERHERKPENRLKLIAHSALSWAIEKGQMSPAKNLLCVHCGKSARHYHHHNGYDEVHKLDVIPLCIPCHRRADGRG